MDNFEEMFQLFFRIAISQNSPGYLQRAFYLFSEPDNYCFDRAAHRQLSKNNPKKLFNCCERTEKIS